jgi:hypothetical protein
VTHKRETASELRKKVSDFEVQMAGTCAFALGELNSAGDKLFGSAAILEIKALGGRQIVRPVAIRDGLSAKTIEAIKDDLRRSFAVATNYVVAGEKFP